MADETNEMTELQEPVLDRSAALERIGDETLLAEIAAIFLNEQHDLVAQIKTAHEVADLPGLERAAHNLKGSVANFGARPAVAAAREIERLAREQDLAGAPQAIRNLEQQLDRLRVELVNLALP